MPKVSILQGLLRQPSQKYSAGHGDDPLAFSRPTARGQLDSASVTSGRSSGGLSSSQGFAAPSWEWGRFGGRPSLTGGAGSLRAPSDIGLDDAFDLQAASKQHRKKKKRTDRASEAGSVAGSAYEDDARSMGSQRSFTSAASRQEAAREWTHLGPSLLSSPGKSSKSYSHGASRRYSDVFTGSTLVNSPIHEVAEPMRRAASTAGIESTSSYRTSSPGPPVRPVFESIEEVAEKPRKSARSTKTRAEKPRTSLLAVRPDLVSNCSAESSPPSLVSSVSSDASSPPVTPMALSPITPSNRSISPPPIPRKSPERRLSKDVQAGAFTPLSKVITAPREEEETSFGSDQPLSLMTASAEGFLSQGDIARINRLSLELPRAPAPLFPEPTVTSMPEMSSSSVAVDATASRPALAALEASDEEPTPSPRSELEDERIVEVPTDEPQPLATVEAPAGLQEAEAKVPEQEVVAIEVAEAVEQKAEAVQEAEEVKEELQIASTIEPVELAELALTPEQAPRPSTPVFDPSKVYSMEELLQFSAPATPAPVTAPPQAAAPPPAPAQPAAVAEAESSSTEPVELPVPFPSLQSSAAAVAEETPSRRYTAEEKGKGKPQEEVVDAAVVAPPPRLQLIRTESDQASGGGSEVAIDTPAKPKRKAKVESPETAASVQTMEEEEKGEEEEVAAPAKVKKVKRSKSRMSTASTTSSQPVYEVIASSKASTKSSTKVATLAKAEQPVDKTDIAKWSRSVRALDDPEQARVQSSLRRSQSTKTTTSASSPTHTSVERVRGSSRGPRSWSSSSSLRPVMPSMPEEPEMYLPSASSYYRPSQSGHHTPRSSISGAVSEDVTIPRRRTVSEDPAARPILRPVPASTPAPDSPSSCAVADSDFSGEFPVTKAMSEAAASEYGRRRSVATSLSVGGQSLSGRTAMSVPTAARPLENPKHVSLGTMNLVQPTTSMRALTISANAAVVLRLSSSSRNSIFGSKTNDKLALKEFSGSRDLHFSASNPPPGKLRSDELLIEVITVGLDAIDLIWTSRVALTREGYGMVPGRSFCGKVVEYGADVTKLKRGDYVYGCADLKTCGALAQFVTINKELVTLAPSCGMPVEQIAALPSAGIPAVQIMEALCQDLPKGSKVLILNAHEGAGNLCMQIAFFFRETRDLWLVAQCPETVADGDTFCRATGASDVIRNEPLAAINGLHESSFDAIIDTIGGRRLYDAGRRILHYEGTYITTVGDDPLGSTTVSGSWKTNVRSLRRSFFKKDKKNVAYWAVTGSELTRESLDTLREAVERGGVRPVVRRVFRFEDSAEAFDYENDYAAGKVVKVLEA